MWIEWGVRRADLVVAVLPWILNEDLELRIRRSLQRYSPRKVEVRVHRALASRLQRRVAEALRRSPPPGEQSTAASVGRPSGLKPGACVIEDAEEQALVLRALRSDREAAGDPVVVEFLGRWSGAG